MRLGKIRSRRAGVRAADLLVKRSEQPQQHLPGPDVGRIGRGPRTLRRTKRPGVQVAHRPLRIRTQAKRFQSFSASSKPSYRGPGTDCPAGVRAAREMVSSGDLHFQPAFAIVGVDFAGNYAVVAWSGTRA